MQWLLPSHGPIFAKDDDLLDRTIKRLESYMHMADFGTCAVDWPLMEQWERDEIMPRDIWNKLGQAGFLCADFLDVDFFDCFDCFFFMGGNR